MKEKIEAIGPMFKKGNRTDGLPPAPVGVLRKTKCQALPL
jgi:hypothetical protein